MVEIKEKLNPPAGGKKITKKVIGDLSFGVDQEEMIKAGLHFGHKKSKAHPKMSQYVSGTRNTIHIIDSEKIAVKLIETLNAIKELVLEGKVILFVGTKVQVKKLVAEIAIECDSPYVNERWLGGSFTNFSIIKKRIDHFLELESKKKAGELEKYTKKERLDIDRALQNFEKKFGGIKKMTKLPDVIFVVDIKKDFLAVKEAKEKGMITMGITDTNVNPELLDYFIPANDDALSSVRYILEKVKSVILENKK